MYDYQLADLISMAMNDSNMGCMAHDWVEVSADAQRAWACWADADGAEHISAIIDIEYICEIPAFVGVWGVGPDGGKGAFYGTVLLP